ncbi:MAG: hypothetical protein JO030_03750 [Candidatus Eremiobacteraeota bacterium]|nr:hypothetical protein [Candidatus Eremiobacteraeota bacterium]
MAALVAGCGTRNAQPFAMPAFTATNSLPGTERSRFRPFALGHARMEPDAKNKDLLYISAAATGWVYVYTYPRGRLVGSMDFVEPEGLCADRSGNIFVPDIQLDEIFEFAHGGSTPIQILQGVPYGAPLDCAVDPVTGNLAVTNDSNFPGNVAVYLNARGTPRRYTLPRAYPKYCTYNDGGTLFVDGGDQGRSELAELPRGANSFEKLSLHQKTGAMGAVQWDGKYVALGDININVVYRLRIEGLNTKVIGTAKLVGAKHVFQFWIQGRRLIGPDEYASDVGFWDYPAGGSATKTIGGVVDPAGSAVSLTANH